MSLKKSKYFQFRSKLPDREWIKDIWIERVLNNRLHQLVQDDGRIRVWGKVPEAEDRVLRVVLLEDGNTVHNAFFDRSFKEPKK